MREKENRGGEKGGYGSKMCSSHLISLFFSGKREKLILRIEDFCIQRIISWLFASGDERNSDHYRLRRKV